MSSSAYLVLRWFTTRTRLRTTTVVRPSVCPQLALGLQCKLLARLEAGYVDETFKVASEERQLPQDEYQRGLSFGLSLAPSRKYYIRIRKEGRKGQDFLLPVGAASAGKQVQASRAKIVASQESLANYQRDRGS